MEENLPPSRVWKTSRCRQATGDEMGRSTGCTVPGLHIFRSEPLEWAVWRALRRLESGYGWWVVVGDCSMGMQTAVELSWSPEREGDSFSNPNCSTRQEAQLSNHCFKDIDRVGVGARI
jgi:hypothetical protein